MLEFKVIEKEALHLPPEDRAQLAQKLLLSLESLSESELEETWFNEAYNRAKEIDSGDVKPISADEVRKKAKALLR